MKNFSFFSKSLLSIFLFVIFGSTLYGQNPVDSWTIVSVPAAPDQDTYTVGGNIYEFGEGNNVEISTIQYLGDTFTIPFASQFYVFNRVDIPLNGNGVSVIGNKASVFFERTGASNFIYEASLPGAPGNIDLEEILRSSVINRGALDVFRNLGDNGSDQGPQNVERIDVVFPGLTINNTPDLSLNGFLASEKSGNNTYKAAAILSIDASGVPTAFGNLVTIVANTSYGIPADDSFNPRRQNAFLEDSNSDNQPLRVGGANERIGISLITFDDLGITAGQTFFGISFFGDDVFDSDNLLDVTTFPQDTGTGADIYGGLGAIVTATGFAPPLDNDSDLVIDTDDLDDDNDGILDVDENPGNIDPSADDDSDGVPNYLDDDPADDTIGDDNGVIEPGFDADNDGIPNHFDVDSDNDGCADAVEAASTFTMADLTADNNLANTPAGVDANGVPTNTGSPQATTPAVTDSTDTSACAPPIDSDGDGITDDVDLDDDNDGIPDLEENISCISITNINTPGFALNTDLTTGPTGDADLDGFDNGTFDFFASLQGGTTWDGGVQIQNDPAIGDYIFTQPQNTGAPSNVATYVYTFPTAIANFSFITGGLNNADEVTITASDGGVNIPIGLANFSNLVQGIEVSGNTVTGTVFDNSFDPLINVFSTIIPGLVDTITITATKGDVANTQVTIGMYSFGYCVVDEFADFDGDGIPNSLDLDSDNDGITDIIEAGGTDTDNDGEVDYPTPGDPVSMTDTNNNGLDDGVEAIPLPLPNSDALGGPNWLDIDADDDGIPDNVEAQPTTGYIPPSGIGAGITDTNTNGVDDVYESGTDVGITPENTDSDTIPDYIDDDSDGDNIPDIAENGDTDNTILGVDTDGDGLDDAFDDTDDSAITGATVNDGINPPNASNLGDQDGDLGTGGDVDYRDILDSDGDGIPDTVDVDDDNDGIADVDENPVGIDPSADDDGDGIPNYLDDNSNNAEIGNDDGLIEDGFDFDNDGIPNHFDIDSDNDGIADVVETGNGDLDTDNDGDVDAADTSFADANNDGQADSTTGSTPANTDGNPNDGSDFLDIDADDDGIPDNVEGQPTVGYIPPSGTDANNNGLDDDYEGTDFIDTPENTDGTDIPDYLDTDSDNDGVDDVIEAGQGTATGTDTDGDGLDDGFDDSNDTGVEPDVNDNLDAGASDTDNDDNTLTPEVDFRETLDIDGDGVNDDVDLDNDNDGIPDLVEGTDDTDGDGIPDYLDLDSDNDGIPDITEAGGTDADGDGQIDYPTPGDPMSLNDANNDGLDDDIAASPLPDTDSDNDDLVDRLDLDSDNDGIADIIEAGGTDSNGDGEVDYATPGDPMTMVDVDGDGFIDTIDTDDNTIAGTSDGGTALPDADTDGDTFPNRLDLDSDNDGIHDVIESGGTDTDSNGTADDDDDNVDNTASNGIPTSAGGGNIPTDTGADGSPDYTNLDSDGDGCSDANEAYANANADGGDGGQFGTGTPAATGAFGLVTAAAYDTGVVATVTDATDATACDVLDTDGDGINDDVDLDDDNDGIPDTVEGTGDSDGDGVPDFLDLDSDNDGIPDILEAGSGRDMDGDGQIDYPIPGDPTSLDDANNDGLDDTIATTPLPDLDSDNDGLVDRLDLDADNDGIADIIEAGGTDSNGDGEVDYATPGDPMTMLDIDGDGFIDTIDTNDNTVAGLGDGGTALPDFDNDQDLLANRLDLDSDNDGIHDVIESGGTDTDSDGTADDDDDNVDNTASSGIPTSAGGGNIPTDTGADGSPDYINLDSDGDGCSDANEAYISGIADGGDGGQFGTGTPAATGAFGLVTAATYDTGVVPAVTDATDVIACIIIDTDGDGVLDDQELADGTNPNDPCDFLSESITEVQGGDFLTADCDGDQIPNGQEIIDGTDPFDPCSNIGGNPPPEANCDEDVSVESDFVNPGVNDGVFQINNIEFFPNNSVRIYNRWGVLVFETQGYDNSSRAFRGISEGRATINTDNELPVGVYFYIIEYVDEGTTEVIDGYLYVNR